MVDLNSIWEFLQTPTGLAIIVVVIVIVGALIWRNQKKKKEVNLGQPNYYNAQIPPLVERLSGKTPQ